MAVSQQQPSGSLPSAGWVLLLTLACLLPFLTKPFHVDDTLFLRTAEQIQKHPADFYGFSLNWFGTTLPMTQNMENPPLAGYYIALVAAIGGWSEPVLHLGFLLIALAAAAGIHSFASHYCRRPTIAAVIAVLTPVFIISSTTLMCDTLLLALWVWSVVFFDRALRKNSPANFVASGALAGLAFWTKFPGLAIAPLLAAYGFCKSFPNLFAPLRGNRVRQAAPISDQSRLLETPTSGDLRAKTGLWLLTPALALVFVAAYEWVTWRLYGHGLFLASARFSSALRAREHGLIMGQLVGVSFLGGAFLPIIFYAPALWPDRKLRLAFLASMLFGFIGSFCNPFSAYVWHGRGNPDWTMLLQTILFIACGAQVLLLAVLNFWQERNAEALLLMLWTWGIFVFATVFNWTCNSRSLLPMLPAVSVLLAQRLIPDTADSVLSWRTLWPALPALALCLLVTQADYDLAESARCAAKDLCAKYGRSGRRVWFEHHWGFQYYMEQKGAKALEIDLRQMQHGDLVVIPAEGIGGSDLPCNLVRIVDMLTYPPNRYFSTRSASAGAGFYAAIGGPYPFSAGCASPDCYYVFEVVQTLTEASQNGGLSSTGAVAEQFDVVRQAIALQQTLLTHPNDADAHLQLGRFFASRSNFAAAAKHFAEVLRLRPNDGAATAEMAALSLHAASSNTSAKQ